MPKRISRSYGKRQLERCVVTRRAAYLVRYWPNSVQLVRVVHGRFRTWEDGRIAVMSGECIMPAKPVTTQGGSVVLPPHADPGKWGLECPLLSGYLTDPVWPDGQPRVPARLFITPGSGHWEYTLKEPSTGLLLVAVVDNPVDGLAALEQLLASPGCPWRADPWARPQKGKKK